VDSALLLPMSAQQQAAAQQEPQEEVEGEQELLPRQLLFGEGGQPSGPHWQRRATPGSQYRTAARTTHPAATAALPVAAAAAPAAGSPLGAGAGFSFPSLQQQQQPAAAGLGKVAGGLTSLRGAYATSSPGPSGLRSAATAPSPVQAGRGAGLMYREASQDASAMLYSQPQQPGLSPVALAKLQAGLPASQQEHFGGGLPSPGLAAAGASPLRYRGAPAAAAVASSGAGPSLLSAALEPFRSGFPGFPGVGEVVWIQRRVSQVSSGPVCYLAVGGLVGSVGLVAAPPAFGLLAPSRTQQPTPELPIGTPCSERARQQSRVGLGRRREGPHAPRPPTHQATLLGPLQGPDALHTMAPRRRACVLIQLLSFYASSAGLPLPLRAAAAAHRVQRHRPHGCHRPRHLPVLHRHPAAP
jgi:hypothetical protein